MRDKINMHRGFEMALSICSYRQIKWKTIHYSSCELVSTSQRKLCSYEALYWSEKGERHHEEDEWAVESKNDGLDRPGSNIFLHQVHLHWKVNNHRPKHDRSSYSHDLVKIRKCNRNTCGESHVNGSKTQPQKRRYLFSFATHEYTYEPSFETRVKRLGEHLTTVIHITVV